MKLILNLLCLVLLSYANDGYNDREVSKNNIRTEIVKEIDSGLNIYFKQKLLKKYNFEGSLPSLKQVIYSEKNIFALLVSWRTLHRGLGIDGEYYQLDIFKIKGNGDVYELDTLSKTGFDGRGEDGNEVFKYKKEEIIIDYIKNKIDNRENIKYIQVKKQYLYSESTKKTKTKMYLLKGDKLEILKEENNWLYVLYKGKKEIKAWIPKSSIEEQKVKPITKTEEIKEEKSFFTKLLEFFNLTQLNKSNLVMKC